MDHIQKVAVALSKTEAKSYTYYDRAKFILQAIDFAKLKAERDQLRLALQEAQEGKNHLTRLFKQLAPQCEPLPDLPGLTTQIDNYIAGQKLALQESRRKVVDLETLTSKLKDSWEYSTSSAEKMLERQERATQTMHEYGDALIKANATIMEDQRTIGAQLQVIQRLGKALQILLAGVEQVRGIFIPHKEQARAALQAAAPWLRKEGE